ncbi:hypothetical protein H6F88_30845 [Oculatella sp. FACHB-28]|uniref:hypothetical protein n=1 Tax=Leptolyngbya sp. FACHB-671 TaxID=2692812 RepID=UPI00168565F7|nr:hypothetical protein [Leptolyngbya sp. FACHB-671]MBD2060342.1 hypothetical protein [Oculatella sp. FACHB-28]MBD2070241.1 hypothetical protein [Leptolyngbya sp. FACHB-671]
MMSRILYMLIAPKGAGKPYIGTLISQHTEICFNNNLATDAEISMAIQALL